MDENPYRAPAVSATAKSESRGAASAFVGRTLIVFGVINSCCAAILTASIAAPWIAVFSLPVCWPFFIFFGCDETTEMYGRYGELLRVWISSIPTSLAYAVLASLARTKAGLNNEFRSPT